MMSDAATTQRAIVIDPDANLTDEEKIERLREYAAELAAKTEDCKVIIEELVMSATSYFGYIWPEDHMQWIEETAQQAIVNRPQNKADEILQHGDPLAFFRSTFQTFHAGDRAVLDTVICGAAVQSVLNAQGIQPAVSGPKGVGKTSAMYATVHLCPEEYVLVGTFSDKALFYNPELKDGSIILSDDTELSRDANDTVKRSTSNFQKPTMHQTVVSDKDKGFVTTEHEIPPHLMFLFTSVDDTGDDQLNDRQYKISLANSSNDLESYDDFLKNRMENGLPDYPVTADVLICRDILRQVKTRRFRVRISFARRIQFRDKSRKRDMRMFFDFIAASTVLFFRQRTSTEDTDAKGNRVIVLDAEEADFYRACEVFAHNADTRKFRLNKEERAILDFGISLDRSESGIPFPELVKIYAGLPQSRMRTLLFGRSDTHSKGLTSKIPGMYTEWGYYESAGGKRQSNIVHFPAEAKEKIEEMAGFVVLQPRQKKVEESDNGEVEDGAAV